MLFILYGNVDRDRYVKGGSFACPQCGQQKYCTRRKIETWFTVFFVPILPQSLLFEYLKCHDCHHSFTLPDLKPFFPGGGYLPSDLRAELFAGASLEDVEQRLVASGVDQVTAAQVVGDIAGDRRKHCPACDLTYQEHLPECRKCSRPLVKVSPMKIGFEPIDGF